MPSRLECRVVLEKHGCLASVPIRRGCSFWLTLQAAVTEDRGRTAFQIFLTRVEYGVGTSSWISRLSISKAVCKGDAWR